MYIAYCSHTYGTYCMHHSQSKTNIFAHYSHLILMQIPRSCLISIFLDCVCFLLSKCACLCNFSKATKTNTNTNTMHAHRFVFTAVHMFSLIHSIICAENICMKSSSSSSTHHQRNVPFCTICSRKRKITIIHLGSTGRAHTLKHAHTIHNIYLAVVTHIVHHLPATNYIIDRIL